VRLVIRAHHGGAGIGAHPERTGRVGGAEEDRAARDVQGVEDRDLLLVADAGACRIRRDDLGCAGGEQEEGLLLHRVADFQNIDAADLVAVDRPAMAVEDDLARHLVVDPGDGAAEPGQDVHHLAMFDAEPGERHREKLRLELVRMEQVAALDEAAGVVARQAEVHRPGGRGDAPPLLDLLGEDGVQVGRRVAV